MKIQKTNERIRREIIDSIFTGLKNNEDSNFIVLKETYSHEGCFMSHYDDIVVGELRSRTVKKLFSTHKETMIERSVVINVRAYVGSGSENPVWVCVNVYNEKHMKKVTDVLKTIEKQYGKRVDIDVHIN